MIRCDVDLALLVSYHHGLADAAVAEMVGAHIASGCKECRSRLEWLTAVQPALRDASFLRSVAQSSGLEAATGRARSLFRERNTKPALPRVLAALMFDSRTSMSPSFARGESGEACQQIFATEEHNVELWQEHLSDGGWYLIGQVLPRYDGPALTPEAVTLSASGVEAYASETYGSEFHMSDVAEGEYEMCVRLASTEILLPTVMVGTK